MVVPVEGPVEMVVYCFFFADWCPFVAGKVQVGEKGYVCFFGEWRAVLYQVGEARQILRGFEEEGRAGGVVPARVVVSFVGPGAAVI